MVGNGGIFIIGGLTAALVEIAVPIGIVTAAYVIRALFGIPFYVDPYGKKSEKLTHEKMDQFINWALCDAEKLGKKNIKIVSDKDELEKILPLLIRKGFATNAVIGPLNEESIQNVSNIRNFSIKCLNERPLHHFAIIGPHLLVENPHEENQGGSGLGIHYPDVNYYNIFLNKFQSSNSEANVCSPSAKTLQSSVPDSPSSLNR